MDAGGPSVASTASSELHYLIAKFLCAGPCRDIGQALKCELERRKILPQRLDWTGQLQEQTFDELDAKFSQLDEEHLLLVCQRLGPLLSVDSSALLSVLDGAKEIRGAGRGSLLQPLCSEARRRSPLLTYSRLRQAPDPVRRPSVRSAAQMLLGRENGGRLVRAHAQSTPIYNRLQLGCRLLGHLSAVYCVLFDRSGRFVITGADDLLVKIWDAHSGRLLATLRGASMEITDIDINPENTLLAAGCLDRIVRVWCLQTTAPVAVLSAHNGMITSVKWCPFTDTGDFRYLISSSADGSVAFWSYTHNILGKSVHFNPKPIQYHERMRPGQAQIICASFSPGGAFLAAASADHHVRVYMMVGDEGPNRIFEKEVHTDRVDSIQWAASGLRFVSGSKDGTALIWRFEANDWHHILLDMQKRLTEPTEEEAKQKLKVTMVGWAMNDEMVLTAVSDFSLRVWDSTSGRLMHVLKGHKDDFFVLERNPMCPHLVLSAGHDGQIILWDLAESRIVKSFLNSIEGQGYGAVYDAKWSPDGLMAAATDSHGHLLLYGLCDNQRYKKVPKDMYFHTDYRPLVRDTNHWVLDEQTQMAPHLMPPPFLVDIDGNPYPPIMQRLVPGRAAHRDEQLVPNLVVNEDGDREVQDQARSNIDEMIEQLAARQNAPNVEHAYARAPQPQQQQRGGDGAPPLRRTGDVEGVRQSSGNWQRGSECSMWLKHDLVALPTKAEHEAIQSRSQAHGRSELHEYYEESTKQPAAKAKTASPQVPKAKLKSPRKQPPSASGGSRSRGQDASNNTYRTRNSRLGDDFVDPENISVTSSSNAGGSDSSSDSGAESSSNSSDSSEYSDWVADNSTDRQATLQPPKRNRRRRVVLRRSSKEDNDEEESDEEQEEEEHSDPSGSPEPGPSQSSKRDSRLRQAPKKTKRHEDDPLEPPRIIKNAATAKLLSGEVKEVPEQYKPSEWLAEVIPRKTPYFPQIGDELVYFRQGHQNYLNVTRAKQLYEPGARCEPWIKQQLREVEYVRVVGIKYEIRPPRLCCLRLAITDPTTGAFSSYFNIKYHDIPDVIDFLVLRQYYDAAMGHNWKVGEHFRSLIDDSWWIGVIEAQNAVDLDFPDSPFQCFQVRWDSGETERMSPWDLEAVDPKRLPAEKGGAVDVLQEEIQASLYESTDVESWPPSGDRDLECQRLTDGIEQIMALSVAEPFNAPVDLNQYPSYALLIAYPIDLTTIRTRLENRFYRSVQALQFDVRYIASNAEKFNQRKSAIVKQANVVTELCLKVTKEHGTIDVLAEYHKLVDNYKSESSEPEEDDNEHQEDAGGCRRSSRKSSKSNKANRIQRPRRNNAVKKDPDEWKEKCSDLLHQLWQSRDSEPFREPVDLLVHLDYTKTIDTPMDLGTIREQLEAGNYESPTEFAKDTRLIFANSKNYNTNKKSKIYAMTVRLSTLFENGFHPILSDWKSQQRTNGSPVKSTRSTAQTTKAIRKSESCSSSSSFAPSRSSRLMNGNSALKRLKISSDSDASSSSRPTRSSAKVAASPDPSTSTSLPSSSSTKLPNGSSRAAPATRLKVSSATSDEEDDVDVGGSSPSESRPESANQAHEEEDDDDDSESASDASDVDSDSDEEEEEDVGRSKRPSRAAASKRRRTYSSESSVEPTKRPRRSAPPAKRPAANSSGRNQRQRKAVSYQELSEDEFRSRRPVRASRRNCIKSDTEDEDANEEEGDGDDQPSVSVSSRGRVRKLTEKARGLFD